MEAARILVAVGNDASAEKMKAALAEGGFNVVDHAREGNECLRKIRILKLDLLVIDYDLPYINGLEVAKIALEDKLCDVILLVSCEKRNSLEYIKSSYDIVMLTKPLNRDNLINTANLMVKNRKKIIKLEKEVEELRTTLDARKDIEKAKGLLMKHLNLSEEQAFKRIRKQSMDRAVPMREIARAIILYYDI